MHPQFSPFTGTSVYGYICNGSVTAHPDTQSLELRGGLSRQSNLQGSGIFEWRTTEDNFLLDFMLEEISPGAHAGFQLAGSADSTKIYFQLLFNGEKFLVHHSENISVDFFDSEKAGPLQFMRLQRSGEKLYVSVAPPHREASLLLSASLKELRTLFAGVLLHPALSSEPSRAVLSGVRFTLPREQEKKFLTKSRLELMEVATGRRRLVYQEKGRLEAPNWSADGQYVLFNREGLLYKLSLKNGSEPEELKTGEINRMNNDHGFSPDGKQVAVSHHLGTAPADENSAIFIMNPDGSAGRQITPKTPSYWHGWSPDGQTLLYTALRNNAFDIFSIAIDGGEEVNLTNSPAMEDGPAYHPSGEHIYFNSDRSGSMEIWRMQPDGSQPEQVTSDHLQNWFPHPSPDGNMLVFMSYLPEVVANKHPADQLVMLRTLNLQTREIKVIAHLYGGQGTINVPSWSPDSQQVAFFSYTYDPLF